MNPVERLLGAVINPVVDAVDVDGMVSKVDVDRLVSEVDLDALLEKVDLDALLARIDVDALLDRIDVDELLARIDVNKLTDRMDVQALIERLDMQSMIDKVDLDAVLANVDVAAIAQRAGIDQIVSDATRGVSTRVLAMARRQIVGLEMRPRRHDHWGVRIGGPGGVHQIAHAVGAGPEVVDDHVGPGLQLAVPGGGEGAGCLGRRTDARGDLVAGIAEQTLHRPDHAAVLALDQDTRRPLGSAPLLVRQGCRLPLDLPPTAGRCIAARTRTEHVAPPS